MPDDIPRADLHKAVVTVTYQEAAGSPNEDANAESGNGIVAATRVLHCEWSDRLQLARELTGYVRDAGLRLIKYAPDVYPWDNTLQVVNVSCRPLGESRGTGGYAPSGKLITYEKAELTVDYAIPEPEEEEEDSYVRERIEPVAEYLTIPGKNLYWDDAQAERIGEDGDNINLGRVNIQINWVVERSYEGEIPANVIKLVGTTNEKSIRSSRFNFSFPPETLLFNPPDIELFRLPDGGKGFTITYQMTFQPGGWNNFYRDGATRQPIYDGTGTRVKPYAPKDWGNIISKLQTIAEPS